MSNIITSQVDGVDFDPESIAEEPMDLEKAVRDLDKLIAKQLDEEATTVVRPAFEPTYLQLSYDDRSHVYYFKCHLISFGVGMTDNMVIEASQSQLLKLLNYWLDSSSGLTMPGHIKHRDSKIRRWKTSKHGRKLHLLRAYTHVNGVQRNLIDADHGYIVSDMEYRCTEDNRSIMAINLTVAAG